MKSAEGVSTKGAPRDIQAEPSDDSMAHAPVRLGPQSRSQRVIEALRRIPERYPTLVFLAAYLFLNTAMNLRYPGREPLLWYVIPSVDVLFVLLYLAWFGAAGWRVPNAVRIGLVVCVVLVRIIRVGDGVQNRFFAQQFSFYTDLPLAPELVRFLWSTLSIPEFVLAVVGALATLAALPWVTYHALLHIERYLTERRHTYFAGATAGLLFVGAWRIGHRPQHQELFLWKGLSASVGPRLRHEAAFLFNVFNEKAEHARAITVAQERYRHMGTNLAKLGGANVHLILVESYGQCILEWPPHVEYMKETFAAFESELSEKGFSIVTGFLDSSTYGGQSWFAHATLGTGIRITNQLEHEIAMVKKPKTLASFFNEAGYRTVLVAPATSRAWPKGEVYNFEQKYYGWHFGYQGPRFAWSPMPDQFILDFVRRRELSTPSAKPLFIQYLLVSSHAPWSDIPPVIDDWSQIGDGDIYNRVPPHRYPILWPYFEKAAHAYAHSIKYDFQILQRFIADTIQDGSLVIIMGDHQPVWDVNGHSDAWGVPIHVLSRNAELLRPFHALGYTPGLRKQPRGRYAGLETFLTDFVGGLSTPSK